FDAVRPTQPTSGDMAKTQVNAFQAGTKYEDFSKRLRFRHAVDTRAVELEHEVVFVFSGLVQLIEIRAGGGCEGRKDRVQDAVFVQIFDAFEQRPSLFD